MNDKINKFLLAGDKLMPEMHLKQSGFTYSACGPFTKNKRRIQRFLETGNTNYTYRNELDKVCFQHDMAYGDFKDLKRRTQSDKVLKDKAFKIASNPKYDEYQRGLASMVYKVFDKKSRGAGIKENKQSANELHKTIIRKFINKYNTGIIYLLCVIDLFSRYAFVVSLKDKKGATIVNAFRSTLDSSKRNQIKYGLMKVVSFTTSLLKYS